MAAMTFRELVDHICGRTGQSVHRTLADVCVKADVCIASLRTAYRENAVLPSTAQRIMVWARDEHPDVEIGLIHMLMAPKKQHTPVDWCTRAEEAFRRALAQVGIVSDGRIVAVAREGDDAWSVEVDGQVYHGDGSLRGCLEQAKGEVDG